MVLWAVPVFAQSLDLQNDPRQLGLDIYGDIKREVPPATVGLKLGELIQIYRFRCTRVTDYQLFTVRANLIDIKVKCSGDPLYGVTVASNGYVAVYGGNGILGELDRRDAVIYSFAADGALARDSRLTVKQAVSETVDRMDLTQGYNWVYMLGMAGLILLIGVGGVMIWFKAWRRRKGRPRKRRISEPLRRSSTLTTTAAKDILVLESERVMPHIYRHPSGVFIAQGRRGKRRFFNSIIWAVTYRILGWKLFQTVPPKVETAPEDHQ
ncbi:hypothetical protein [Kordiimonas marina]|uniref:hypothetical protein n=1 Tax=Kordiimonas marina TaxID=2872312 RepID=UPI001FF5517A|nr:hypothetical protein [Kordiimonas marina]